jgi:hypothetical protein
MGVFTYPLKMVQTSTVYSSSFKLDTACEIGCFRAFVLERNFGMNLFGEYVVRRETARLN